MTDHKTSLQTLSKQFTKHAKNRLEVKGDIIFRPVKIHKGVKKARPNRSGPGGVIRLNGGGRV